MNKTEFMFELGRALEGLPKDDILEKLSFYEEMIADRMEDGESEEEAVTSVGDVDKIALEIIEEIPLTKIVKEKIKPKRRLRGWEIALICVGFPVWLPLAMSALAIIISLYVVLWSLVVSAWAVFASLIGVALGGVVGGVITAIFNNQVAGIVLTSGGLVCAGLAILSFMGSLEATVGVAKLAKTIVLGIKKMFMKKGEVS